VVSIDWPESTETTLNYKKICSAEALINAGNSGQPKHSCGKKKRNNLQE
jgi:hypothetical protein